MPDHRRKIQDDDDSFVAVLSQVREYGLVRVVAAYPFKAVMIEVILMQGGMLCIKPVQITDQLFDAGM
jgi:hypothetical protein